MLRDLVSRVALIIIGARWATLSAVQISHVKMTTSHNQRRWFLLKCAGAPCAIWQSLRKTFASHWGAAIGLRRGQLMHLQRLRLPLLPKFGVRFLLRQTIEHSRQRQPVRRKRHFSI